MSVEAPASAEELTIRARLPTDVAARTHVTLNGQSAALATAHAGPGMHRVEWAVNYRGGFRRAVGLTQLVGPFQDPVNPPCAMHLLVGQRFLGTKDQTGGGTVAAIARGIVQKQLRSFKRWPIGRFKEVASLRLRWIHLDPNAGMEKLGRRVLRAFPEPSGEGGRIDGYLRVAVKLIFAKGSVDATIALAPTIGLNTVEFRTFASADIKLDNRLYQLVSNWFDGDDIASATAEREINQALRNAFVLPPPIRLPGGGALRFMYCRGEPIAIETDQYASVPIALVLDDGQTEPYAIALGPAPRAASEAFDAPLGVDLGLDAVNGILQHLWSTGFLDRELGRAGLATRFNENSLVQDLLNLRIFELRLTLPPTALPATMPKTGQPRFELSAEASLVIEDGAKRTPARVFSTIGFEFAGGPGAALIVRLALHKLALTCHDRPGELTPCYGDLVSSIGSRADDLHGELARLFTQQFNKLVLQRTVGTDADLARFTIERARVRARAAPPSGSIRVELFGTLATN